MFIERSSGPRVLLRRLETAKRIFLYYCSEYYEPIPETLPNFAKKNGLDAERYNDAVTQALRFYAGENYDASKAMERPSMIVKHTENEVLDFYRRGGKRFLCADDDHRPNDWGTILVRNQIVKRRDKGGAE